MSAKLLLAGALLGSAQAAERGIWLCVGPPPLQRGIEELSALRASQGWQVVCSTDRPREAIAALGEPPSAILVLGDDTAHRDDADWTTRAERRPYHGWAAKHPADFVTDAVLGDLDDDGIPDIPVGRIPARTAAELETVVRKIVAWEQRTPSLGDLSVPLWAGDPGFGAIGAVMKFGLTPYLTTLMRRDAPPWLEFWLLQADPRSPFCGWPADSATAFNRRLAQGGLLGAMIGHGRTDSWWIMNLPDERLFYTAANARELTGGTPAPPHLIFACRSGAFGHPDRRCLAEELLLAPGGPVACVGASVDSHPLTNYYGSSSLLSGLAPKGPDTLGGLWVDSIRRAHPVRHPMKELLVASLEPAIIGTRNRVEDLKADHLLIYNLLGDPATRLFLPQPLESPVRREGEGWSWAVSKPADLPPGAKLHVQHRAPLPLFPRTGPATDRESAAKRLSEANAALSFRTIRELTAEEDWRGTVDTPGDLRLCLTGLPDLHVHAETLTRPK